MYLYQLPGVEECLLGVRHTYAYIGLTLSISGQPEVRLTRTVASGPLWALCVLLQMRLFVSFDDMIG